MLDLGTNNEQFLDDPLYIGLRQRRIRGEAYDAFIDEFVQAVKARFPNALLQFEDFGNKNAFRLLENYRNSLATFNDDIQGTAAVTVAGIFSALRLTPESLNEQRFLFLGAGEAGIGIGELLVSALVRKGMNEDDARRRCWFVDSKGLVVKSRDDLAAHKLLFAHDAEFVPTLLDAVKMIKPTAIIGVSGQANTFTQEIVHTMSELNSNPIIFALSNPTSKAECTAEEAYTWSKGQAIFASGSPFNPVDYNGRRFVPGQANNSYVFPGIGLGVLVSEAAQVSDEMFLAAALKLATMVGESDLRQGRIFPPLSEIRNISAQIAAEVALTAEKQGLAGAALPDDLVAYIRSKMYEPVYQSYV
jgi:malate dehydrogenase (oxaloacetate-decarboxylating)(NADP+)